DGISPHSFWSHNRPGLQPAPIAGHFLLVKDGRRLNFAHPNQIASLEVPPPLSTPVYRLDRSFEQNAAEGPCFAGPYVDVPATPMKDFFGHRVASRIGVAAGLLGNERWF